MKSLYDYLMDKNREDGEEVTVWDKDYDIEVYFYAPDRKELDDWDKALLQIARKLTVLEEAENGITVNFSEVIERNICNGVFEEIFIINDTDAIMDDLENILGGLVSVDWLTKFADSLV